MAKKRDGDSDSDSDSDNDGDGDGDNSVRFVPLRRQGRTAT
jgi:hypothetical protein